VIGGGVAGLTTALHLAERNLKPLVLEADRVSTVGGCRGEEVEVNGWRFRAEHGVHGIWSPYRNLQAMLAPQHTPIAGSRPGGELAYQRDMKTRMAAVGSAIRNSRFPAPFHYLNLFLRPRFWPWQQRGLDVVFLVWYGLLYAMAVDPMAENSPWRYVAEGPGALLAAQSARFSDRLARNGLSPTGGGAAVRVHRFLRFYTLLRRDAWHFGYLPADGGTSVIERWCAG